jgi:SAM-dependent methyltransferase
MAIKADNNVWDNTWKQDEGEIIIRPLDCLVFQKIAGVAELNGKRVAELGCGRGVLSYLLWQRGAEVTLVDFSQEALKLARKLFDSSKNVEFVYSDLFEFDSGTTFDLVISSGVVEHFSGPLRYEVIQKHLDLSHDRVIFVVPARPHYNTIRHKKSAVVAKYGWQRAFSKSELRALIEQSGEFAVTTNERFYPLYGVGLSEVFTIDSKLLPFRLWNQAIANAVTSLKRTRSADKGQEKRAALRTVRDNCEEFAPKDRDGLWTIIAEFLSRTIGGLLLTAAQRREGT